MQVAPSGGQISNFCKWRHLVAKYAANASSAMLLLNLIQVTESISGSVASCLVKKKLSNKKKKRLSLLRRSQVRNLCWSDSYHSQWGRRRSQSAIRAPLGPPLLLGRVCCFFDALLLYDIINTEIILAPFRIQNLKIVGDLKLSTRGQTGIGKKEVNSRQNMKFRQDFPSFQPVRVC